MGAGTAGSVPAPVPGGLRDSRWGCSCPRGLGDRPEPPGTSASLRGHSGPYSSIVLSREAFPLWESTYFLTLGFAFWQVAFWDPNAPEV